MDTGEKKEITFEYLKSNDYKIVPVTGAVGGLNAYGDLVVNLHYERPPIPKKLTHFIDNNGHLDSDPIVETKDSIIRDVQIGLSMRPEIARELARWLNEQIDKMDKMLDDRSDK